MGFGHCHVLIGGKNSVWYHGKNGIQLPLGFPLGLEQVEFMISRGEEQIHCQSEPLAN